MATVAIKNAQWGAISIELAEGRTLTLKPRETQFISEEDFATEGIQKAFREARITVLPEEQAHRGSGG